MPLQLEQISYPPRQIDLSCFTLLAVCENGNLSFTDFKPVENENDVYALQLNDELYIGSSQQVRKRIHAHYWAMINSRHHSEKVQVAFDKYKSFKAFVIMRCDGLCEMAEQMIIRLLQPSLNANLPHGRTEHHNNIIWQQHRI